MWSFSALLILLMIGTVCNVCCPSAEALSSHLENEHLGSGKGSYTCQWENCTRERKPFIQRQKAIRHIRTHTGLKAYKVTNTQRIHANYSARLVESASPHRKSCCNIHVSIQSLDRMSVQYVTNASPRHLHCWSTRAFIQAKGHSNVKSVGNDLGKVVICESTNEFMRARRNLCVNMTGVGSAFYVWIS